MELESSTKEQIEKMIGDNEVFLFMKGNPDFPMCGFSSVASAILKKTGVEFGHCNVLAVSYTHLTLPTTSPV